MNRIKSRNSNIELLRIIAMLMVVSHHLVVHCIGPQFINLIPSLDFRSIASPEVIDQLCKKHFILSVFYSFGKIANAVFILISGFFLAAKTQDSQSSVRLIKVSKKLLSQSAFAAVVITLLSTFVFLTFPELKTTAFSIDIFNNMSWFVGYYFSIILISELFLNRFLGKASKEMYLAFLLILFSLTQFKWTGILLDSVASGFRSYLTGIFLFSFGGFIRKYDPLSKVRLPCFLAVILIGFYFIFLSSRNQVLTPYSNFIGNPDISVFSFGITNFPEYNILIILFGVSLFELFRRIKLVSIKAINYLSSATFMVYLIHDNAFFYSIWNTQNWAPLLAEDLFGFFTKLCLWVFAVFVVGVLSYLVFDAVSKLCKKFAWVILRE